MLENTRDLLAPVILEKGAILKPSDVLEDRVNENFRFCMHSARRIKNDWLKLEFQGFCSIVVFSHFLVVALLGSDSGLCETSIEVCIGQYGVDASGTNIQYCLSETTWQVEDRHVASHPHLGWGQEVIELDESPNFLRLSPEARRLREIFEGESNRMMKTDSHPLLFTASDKMKTVFINERMPSSDCAVTTESLAEFRLSEVQSVEDQSDELIGLEGGRVVLREDVQPRTGGLRGD